MAARLRVFWPAALALCAGAAYAGWRLSLAGWDPVGLADVGTRYSEGLQAGSEGYDGQFALAIAWDPAPATVAPHLDVPAYRYQRILYPILARVLSLGSRPVIPWMLLVINLGSLCAAAALLATLMTGWGERPVYVVPFALWVGLVAAAGLDLNEPLAFALILAGWLALTRERYAWAAIFLTLALFTKETSLAFWAAGLAGAWMRSSRARMRLLPWLVGGLAFLCWQAWVWFTFGSPGIVSGGAMATGFEWVPFMGLIRIGAVSSRALLLYLVIFGPTIVLPTVWALAVWVRDTLQRAFSAEGWGLAINAALLVFLPFSTYREPLGLLRVATGLVLAVLLYSARNHLRRPLNYAVLWSFLLVVLAKP